MYDWCGIFHRLSNSLHSLSLNLMASIAGSLCFMTQFMRFHSLLLNNTISWILLSKNNPFSWFYYFPILDLVTSLLGHLICSWISVAFLVLSYFRPFSNVNYFWKFFPKIFNNGSKFLSYTFQHFIASDIRHLHSSYLIPKLIDKFFLCYCSW